MDLVGWAVAAAGAGIAFANLRTLGPLWRSPALERPQKIAQTVLMWVVPGSYVFVRQAIMTPGAEQPQDATRSAILSGITEFNAGGIRDYERQQSFADGGPYSGHATHHDAGFGGGDSGGGSGDGGGGDGGGGDGGV